MNTASFAVIVKDDHVLLVRSLTEPEYSDQWSFPGGLVEPGEELARAAEREALEETGVVCQASRLLETVDNHEKQVRVSIFKAAYVSGNLTIDPIEIAEAKWVSTAQALQLPLAYNTKAILAAL